MNEKEALLMIRNTLIARHSSIQNAAVKLGVTTQGLQNALTGKQKKIPEYLLNMCKLKINITYEEKNHAIKTIDGKHRRAMGDA